MSKAILVLNEMPKNCYCCKFYDVLTPDYAKCKITGFEINRKCEQLRCEDCLLKPIPKKKDEHMKFGSWEVTYSINVRNMGYNDALKDILGEEE